MTAGEFLYNDEVMIPHNKDREGIAYPAWYCKEKMIQFANYHIMKALIAAHKNMQLPKEDLEFTLNSYSLMIENE